MPSPSSSSARQARQALADQLRDIRLAAGLTGRDLAARAGWHGGSKVSKIEHGTRPPSGDDIRTWCRVCGVPPERAAELLAEQRAAAGMWVSYQRLNRAGLRLAQQSVRPAFDQASADPQLPAEAPAGPAADCLSTPRSSWRRPETGKEPAATTWRTRSPNGWTGSAC